MKRFALIACGQVTAVVEQETLPEIPGHWVEADLTVGPGALYADGQFTPPTPSTLNRHISQFAFRTRVGDELVALMELEAMHNPSDTGTVQLAKARQRARMARCFSAQYLDLDDAELRAGFAQVQEADFARIFLAPVADKELP